MSLVNFVNLPEQSDEFKVVQIYFHNEPYLLCGVKKSEPDPEYYHEKIVKEFLSNNGIQAGKDYELVSPNNQKWLKIPPVEVEGIYKIVGGGFATINSSDFIFSLPYGSSTDYKKLGVQGVDTKFNELIKETLISQSPNWFKQRENYPSDIEALLKRIK